MVYKVSSFFQQFFTTTAVLAALLENKTTLMDWPNNCVKDA